MKKYVYTLLTVTPLALSLAACSQQTKTGKKLANPAMVHHADDTKGRDHFPMARHATGRNVFIFDPRAGAWAAYDASGNRVKTGRASGGATWCEDVGRACKTAVGHFTVYLEKGKACKSGKYPIGEGGAPMPHCMFFYRGYAIHASNHVPDYNASHGCIRVAPSAAEWLDHNFINPGTTVIVRPYA